MGNYYKVTFELQPFTRDAADLLVAFLADIGYESFEETDNGTIGYIDEVYFDEKAVEELIETFPIHTEISSVIDCLEQTDWNEEWEKNYFKPLILAKGRCVVHSTFHDDYPSAEYEILIDPKMAFGTGHHATTSMMVNHLFNMELEGKRIIDMGTGTGILAIISAMLGAKDITAIEIDEGAYRNAVENASLNDVKVNIIHGDATLIKKFRNIDVFLANINRNIILADIDIYTKTLANQGILILSGFYKDDIPLIEGAIKENGMKIAEIVFEEGDWTSIKAEKI